MKVLILITIIVLAIVLFVHVAIDMYKAEHKAIRVDCLITNKGHTAICNGVIYQCEGECLTMEVKP